MAAPGTPAQWPGVPACYEWLSLDRRGAWRLQGERVTHRGLIEFMNRQYGSDETGRWFVQNGPQRVYVDLAYTPLVFRRQGESWVSHTEQPVASAEAIFLDDDGSLLLQTRLGIGLLDDRDLAGLLGECSAPAGQSLEDNLAALMRGEPRDVFWRDTHRLQPIATVDVAPRFHFIARPRP